MATKKEEKGLKDLHPRAVAFREAVTKEYGRVPDDLAEVLTGCLRLLDLFHRLLDRVQVDGPVLIDGDRARNHPAMDAANKTWAAFCRGCSVLGIRPPKADDGPKRPVGRPPRLI